jgi:hypothetical protein
MENIKIKIFGYEVPLIAIVFPPLGLIMLLNYYLSNKTKRD